MLKQMRVFFPLFARFASRQDQAQIHLAVRIFVDNTMDRAIDPIVNDLLRDEQARLLAAEAQRA